MMQNEIPINPAPIPSGSPNKPTGVKLFFTTLMQQKTLMLMSLPFVIWVLIFKYMPLWGWTIAFQQYKPALSMWEQTWIGWEHFNFLFSDPVFYRVMRNTLAMSVINMVLGFGTAIGLALLFNELKNLLFKRVVQTISYLPYFISWVVAASIVSTALHIDGGIVNEVLMKLGIIQEPVMWLGIGEIFWWVHGGIDVWKNVGWNTIIYLAAMTSIDPGQYEAAEMDGAGRMRRIWHITLPGIRPVIIVLMIMNIGYLLESGFESQYLLMNSLTRSHAENLDIFVLRYGINLGNYSLATAAGIFKTVISFILLFAANNLAKRFGQARLF